MRKLYLLNLLANPLLAAGLSVALGTAAGVIQDIGLVAVFGGLIGAAVSALAQQQASVFIALHLRSNLREVVQNDFGTVTMTQLLKASMRMRRDRILVGQVRGHEGLDLLMGWNTGHPGGIATLHADNARDR
jgi:Type II/IV secretion system protein